MFINFRKEWATQASKVFNAESGIFLVDVDPDVVWDTYLNSFDKSVRASFDCRNCRSFLKKVGHAVAIDGNYNLITMWDFIPTDDTYKNTVYQLNELIKNKAISSAFISEDEKIGVESNIDIKRAVTWHHFSYTLARGWSSSAAGLMSRKGDAKRVLERWLPVIKREAVEYVITAIQNKDLYRGEQFLEGVLAFSKLLEDYSGISDAKKQNFLWASVFSPPGAICNTVIGTLLRDLSEATHLTDETAERIVRSFESKMLSYNRPKEEVTNASLNKLREAIEARGLVDALERRVASEDDLDVSKVLYINNSTEAANLFAAMQEEVVLEASKIRPSEEINMKDFEGLVKKTRQLEILCDPELESNLFCLITSDTKGLFWWDNPFSWSYFGGRADSGIKRRVTKAGGSVVGNLRASLSWNTKTDLDLHLNLHGFTGIAKAEHIYFGSPGMLNIKVLDVDAQNGTIVKEPVENMIFKGRTFRDGIYKFHVNNYRDREPTSEFTVEFEWEGKIYSYFHKTRIREDSNIRIPDLVVKNGVVIPSSEFLSFTSSSGDSADTSIWGLKFNRFKKVSSVFYSPNYWEGEGKGAKHLFIHVEGMTPDGEIRPFYNEQIAGELLADGLKRPFEALASKIQVKPSHRPVAGFGFLDSVRKSFVVRADKRVIKVNV